MSEGYTITLSEETHTAREVFQTIKLYIYTRARACAFSFHLLNTAVNLVQYGVQCWKYFQSQEIPSSDNKILLLAMDSHLYIYVSLTVVSSASEDR